jgi:hypothetical protein
MDFGWFVFIFNVSQLGILGMENYLYDNSPSLGGITFNVYNVTANYFSEVITFNDTQVHSLPLLINFYDNLKLQQHGELSVETSITPLGIPRFLQPLKKQEVKLILMPINLPLPFW